jgi:hypothetical protein
MVLFLTDFFQSFGVFERALGPLIGVAVGAFLTALLTRRSQFNQWLRDRKLQEYTELLDVLLERKEAILWGKSNMGVEVLSPQQQADETRKYLAVSKTFQNRLFIDKSLRKLQVLEKWSETEREASDDTSSYVQCETKLNQLIDAIRKAAQDEVR